MVTPVIHRFNAVADELFSLGATHFVQIAVLAVLLAVIDLTLGRRIGAYWRCALWLLFFVRLALPPQLALPSSPMYWLSHDGDRARPASTMAAAAARPQEGWSESSANAALGANTTAAASGVARGESVSAARPDPTWRACVVGAWAVGVVAMGVVTLLERRRLWRTLRRSEAPPRQLLAALADAMQEVGLKRGIRLRLTEAPIGPLVTGVWRPTIFLPRRLADELSREQLHGVLVHELLHVTRGDLWVTLVQAIARVLFFHHPAVWWVNAHLARLREEATDRAVLWHPEVNAHAYSLALVAAAEVGLGSRSLSRFALGVIETKSQLEKRIKMNLHSSRPRRTRLGRAGLFSLAGLASILVPMAPAGSASVPSGPPAGFKAVDAGPIVQAIDATSDRIFADFNRRDRDAYVAAFTRDAFIMPPGAGLQTGHVGAAEGYMRAPGGLMYAGLQWKDRRCFRIGPWWIDTGLVALKFRLNVDAPEMSDPRSALTIWEEGADHALRVKVLAWNPLPSAPQFDGEPALAFEPATTPAPLSTTGDFKPVLEAEVAFHRAIEERKYADAAAYYAPQALLLPPGTAPARGQAAIRRHLEGNPAEHPVIRIDRTVAHVEGNADFVLVVNLFRWTFSPANGSAAATVSGKGVHLWQRDADGGWRILFDLPNPSQRSPE